MSEKSIKFVRTEKEKIGLKVKQTLKLRHSNQQFISDKNTTNRTITIIMNSPNSSTFTQQVCQLTGK